MSDIFISYSRKDAAFVRELKARLEARQREVWVDLEGIPPTAEWLAEIKSAIEAAHAIVVVLSPHSLSSDICREELQHAEQHAKRLIPVLCADVDRANVPASLSVLNWVVAPTPDDMDRAVEQIITALDTDLEWVKAHTRQLTRATEWEHRHRDKSLLLRGRDLAEAQTWLQNAVAKEPRPTELQAQFIQSSAVAARQRRRTMIGTVGVGLAIAGTLSAMVVARGNERDRARQVAEAESLRAEGERRIKRVETANRLANQSADTLPAVAVPLALTAVRITEPDPPTGDAKQALLNALFRLQNYPFTGIPAFSPRVGLSSGGDTYPISFSPTQANGDWLLGRIYRHGVRGWQICAARPLCGDEAAVQPVNGAPTTTERLTSAVFSTNGKWYVETRDSGRVAHVWEIADTGSSGPVFVQRHRIQTSGRDARVLAAGNDGRWLVMQSYRARHVELWELSTNPPSRAHTLGAAEDLTEVSAASLSFDDRWLAVAAGRVGTRKAVTVWDLGSLDNGPIFELPRTMEIRHRALMFSNDDRWLVGGVGLWDFADIRTGGDQTPHTLPTHGALTVAFSPDSRWLVTGARARGNENISTYLWDLEASDPRLTFLVLPHQLPSGSALKHSVEGTAFSRDGRWLATATSGSVPNSPKPPTVFLWPLHTDDLLTVACEVAGSLNEEQWMEHVPDEPYRAMCSDRVH